MFKNKFLGCFDFVFFKKEKERFSKIYMTITFIFQSIFILWGFSFTDTDNSQDSSGREGIIFYSTLPLPPAHEHSDIYLQLCMWDDYHIFNRTACIYQAATRWDLPPYRITIWLIDDVILSFCLFTWWLQCCRCNVCNCKVAMLSRFNIVWFT